MRKIIFTMVMAGCMVVGLNAQALKVDAMGNVGVGTGTPAAKFHILDGTANLHAQASTSAPLAPSTIDITGGSSGSLRVGAIDLASNSFGGAAFQAFSDASPSFKGQFYFEAGSAVGADLFFRTRNPGNGTRMVIKKDGKVGMGILAPTETLDVSGNIKATGTIMGSDRRLKSDIQNYDNGLDQVLNLRPVRFTYNGKGGTIKGDEHIGLIAQELQEIAPEMVKEFTFQDIKEATLDEEYQLLGKQNYLAIKDNEIKYLLVNAIQEQQKIIDEKEERILDLEDRLTNLEDKISQIINQTDVNLGGGLSDAGSIGQNVPNPFNGETRIAYAIPEKSTSAQINIFDLNGKMLKTIPIQHTGKGQLNVAAEQLPSGTYSYQLVIDNQIIGAKKMVLAK